MHHLPRALLAIGADELHHLQAVGEELVVEYPVSCLHGHQHCHNVGGFPEEELLVVVRVVALKFDEILGYLHRARLESVSLTILPLALPWCLIVVPPLSPMMLVLMLIVLVLLLVLTP